MIEQLRRLYDAAGFQPFTIVTSSGEQFEVPTRDHLAFNPQRTYVLVVFDDGTHTTLTGLHIIGVVEKTLLPA